MIIKQAWREQNWEKKKDDGTMTPTTKPLCRKEQSEEIYVGNSRSLPADIPCSPRARKALLTVAC